MGKAYRVLGTTDDVTACDLCGRKGLKSTVALQPLTDGSPDGEPVYFGCDCAARAMGWSEKDVRKAVTAVEREKAAAAERRQRAIDAAVWADPAHRAADAAYKAYKDRLGSRYFDTPLAERCQHPLYLAWFSAAKAAREAAAARYDA